MIDFHFERLRCDGNELVTDWDLLLRPVATFSIVFSGAPIPLYREDEFCVVEFASQITQWLRNLDQSPSDFSYTSMESDEANLVSIKRQQVGWKVAALHQDYVEDRLVSTADIEKAVDALVTQLKVEVREKCRRDISHLVSGGPVRL